VGLSASSAKRKALEDATEAGPSSSALNSQNQNLRQHRVSATSLSRKAAEQQASRISKSKALDSVLGVQSDLEDDSDDGA
jgi:phosphosulfolactate phosphohydrolase-like enzyme